MLRLLTLSDIPRCHLPGSKGSGTRSAEQASTAEITIADQTILHDAASIALLPLAQDVKRGRVLLAKPHEEIQ